MMSPIVSTFNLIIDGDTTQFTQCQFSSVQSVISLSESQLKRMRKSKNQNCHTWCQKNRFWKLWNHDFWKLKYYFKVELSSASKGISGTLSSGTTSSPHQAKNLLFVWIFDMFYYPIISSFYIYSNLRIIPLIMFFFVLKTNPLTWLLKYDNNQPLIHRTSWKSLWTNLWAAGRGSHQIFSLGISGLNVETNYV